jgi:glycosyltransferase involved in cell wall biosynthesis
MRILHIASGDFFSTYGGGQVYVKNVVNCMIGMGLDVAVISSVAGLQNLTEKQYREHKLIEIPADAGESILSKAIEICEPDIIHAHSLKHLVCRIGKSIGVPVVVTSHHGGILCPAGTRLNCQDEICHAVVNHQSCLPCVLRNTRSGLRYWYPFMRWLSPKVYVKLGKFLDTKPFIPFITPIGIAARQIEEKKHQWNEITEKCELMIAPCTEIAEAMVQNGLNRQKVRILPHGIPLPKCRPEYPPIIDGRVKFYFVGRISYCKGLHILLKAFSQVDNKTIELHLIGGVGNKSEARYMSALKKQYCNDTRIVWHGKVAPDNVFEVTSNFHVSSSSSYLEAFGLNIAEALALGKPVIATRCGGGEMQIKDGINGWLVPTNDATALADIIRYIANHPDVLPKMSDNCHAISIDEHCKNLVDIYKSC